MASRVVVIFRDGSMISYPDVSKENENIPTLRVDGSFIVIKLSYTKELYIPESAIKRVEVEK